MDAHTSSRTSCHTCTFGYRIRERGVSLEHSQPSPTYPHPHSHPSHPHLHTPTHIHICTPTPTHAHICTPTPTHTSTHTFTHTHPHTHVPQRSIVFLGLGLAGRAFLHHQQPQMFLSFRLRHVVMETTSLHPLGHILACGRRMTLMKRGKEKKERVYYVCTMIPTSL